MLVATWDDKSNLIRVGLDDLELDKLAEQQVAKLIANADVLEDREPIRPLHVLVAASLNRLQEHFDDACRAVSLVSETIRSEHELRARLEDALKGMDRRDAVLIRNYFGSVWGEQRLSIEKLILRHPLLFDGIKRNTLDQRINRQLKILMSQKKTLPTHRRVTLIDLMLEQRGEL